jgi:hypothetical protein
VAALCNTKQLLERLTIVSHLTKAKWRGARADALRAWPKRTKQTQARLHNYNVWHVHIRVT